MHCLISQIQQETRKDYGTAVRGLVIHLNEIHFTLTLTLKVLNPKPKCLTLTLTLSA